MGVIRQMHKLIYRDSLTLEQATTAIGALKGSQPDADTDVEAMLAFLAGAKRGIVR
jgi:UDP-N-acetylglucosamine acyltransferase